MTVTAHVVPSGVPSACTDIGGPVRSRCELQDLHEVETDQIFLAEQISHRAFVLDDIELAGALSCVHRTTLEAAGQAPVRKIAWLHGYTPHRFSSPRSLTPSPRAPSLSRGCRG